MEYHECDRERERYDPDSINQISDKYICLDPAWSSQFWNSYSEWLRSEKIINIVYAEELDKPGYEEAVGHVFRLSKQIGNIKNIAVDSSAS